MGGASTIGEDPFNKQKVSDFANILQSNTIMFFVANVLFIVQESFECSSPGITSDSRTTAFGKLRKAEKLRGDAVDN